MKNIGLSFLEEHFLQMIILKNYTVYTTSHLKNCFTAPSPASVYQKKYVIVSLYRFSKKTCRNVFFLPPIREKTRVLKNFNSFSTFLIIGSNLGHYSKHAAFYPNSNQVKHWVSHLHLFRMQTLFT